MIKKINNIECWQEYGEIKTIIHCWCDSNIVEPLLENNLL